MVVYYQYLKENIGGTSLDKEELKLKIMLLKAKYIVHLNGLKKPMLKIGGVDEFYI